jgi:hypothetical protein
MIGTAFTAVGLVANLMVPPTAPADDWNTMPCTKGQLYPEQSIITKERSIIPGTIGCTSNEPDNKFAIAFFYSSYPTGYILDQMMMLEYPLEPPMSSSPPSGNFYVLEEPPYLIPNPDALCLVSDPHARISCVRITFDDNDLRVVASLSIDDNIVQKDVEIGSPGDPQPHCATCRRQLLPGDPPVLATKGQLYSPAPPEVGQDDK